MHRQFPAFVGAMRRHRQSRNDSGRGRMSDLQDVVFNDYYGPQTRTTSSGVSPDHYQDSWGTWDDRLNEHYNRESRRARGAEGWRQWRGNRETAFLEYGNSNGQQVWQNVRADEQTQQHYGYYTNRDGSYSHHNEYNYNSQSSWDRHGPDTYYRDHSHTYLPQRGPYNLGQRRGFSSSTSRPNTNTTSAHDANRNSAGAASTARRLFQHRNNLTRVDPVDLIRSRRRQAPPPNPDSQSVEDIMAPSEEYLKTSLEKSETLDGDTNPDVVVEGMVRKLLVLDLNGTLVYRTPHKPRRGRYYLHGGAAPATAEDNVYAQFNTFSPRPNRTAHPRPYLNSFRDYLFHPNTKRWLDTMVWSSAQPHSVNDMVEKCFGVRKGELVTIWARDRLGLDAHDYNRKVQTTKDLNKAWDELDSTFSPEDPINSSQSPPPSQRRHSARSTILLDDSPLKAHLQPYNHLCLKEYDQQMRKHDLAVRELEVVRERYAGTLAREETINEISENTAINEHSGLDRDVEATPSVTSTSVHHIADGSLVVEENVNDDGGSLKRRRKEKKVKKKQEQIERRLEEEQADGGHEYDQTLLAVVGVLDAVRLESNVAAWVRSGGLLQTDSHSCWFREESVDLDSTTDDDSKIPRKKARLSWEAEQEPPSSSPPLKTSQSESDPEHGTENTGVPVDDPQTISGGTRTVEAHLWFNHPGTLTYWARRGRRVLEDMGIDVSPGISGTG